MIIEFILNKTAFFHCDLLKKNECHTNQRPKSGEKVNSLPIVLVGIETLIKNYNFPPPEIGITLDLSVLIILLA